MLLASYRELIPAEAGREHHLGAVVGESLAHPGSFLRAQVAWSVGRGVGLEVGPARDLALAIEAFHTASLLLDDLPAMDDATERRGRPCPHVLYGEGATILGSLGLITRAYALVWRALSSTSAGRRRRAADLVEETLGVHGILDGQARDLHFGEAPRTVEDLIAVAQGKTVSLVRLTLLLPAVVAGVGRSALRHIDRLAEAWGLAYQGLDDFRDTIMSREETGKSTGRDEQLGRPNLPSRIGVTAALARLDALLEQGDREVAALAARGLACEGFRGLGAVLRAERTALDGRLLANA
jgi:geranylgeranyl pyrophosphate synthase